MKPKNFADRLMDAIDAKRNPSIIGLDSEFSKLPGFIKEDARNKSGSSAEAVFNALLRFNTAIIDSIKDIVPAVKLQSAFYEECGPAGMRAFLETARYAKNMGLIVVGDMKRSDIGNTSAAYSSAYLGRVHLFGSMEPAYDLDCITVNPYLGSDSMHPFLDDCRNFGKGIFVLVKTSNPSSSEIQDLLSGNKKVYEIVAGMVDRLGSGLAGKRGYSAVGAVVGATYPKEAEALRKLMPEAVFLVPGYGAQGGSAADIAPCFNRDGYGALVHSSRAVIFAFQKSGKEERFGAAAREAALQMKKEISAALREKRLYPW